MERKNAAGDPASKISMIVIVSDLHFEEEASDMIPARGGHKALVFRRNLEAKAYVDFIDRMATIVEHRKIKEFHFVVAGDLFDFNRTTLWFRNELRPYVPVDKVNAQLEAKILGIISAITAEPTVREALEALRLLANGRYRCPLTGKERDFPAKKVEVHYMVGNHDRLSNATPAIRKRVRELIGLKGSDKFPRYLLVKDPGVLIRHGHEYDSNNFGINLEQAKKIPLKIPDRGYDSPNFGDYITIDVAARLPYLFRRKYGDETILGHSVMRQLYRRLLQFDDVRPQSALFDYILDDSTADYSSEEAWERLVPVVIDILDEIHDNKFFRECLRKQARPWAPAELEAARGLLKLGGWRNRMARDAARKIAHFMMGGEMARPELIAQREEVLLKKKVRLVISGHTHHPQVSLIAADTDSDRFYINTGTWRSRIPSTPDRRTFGRIKALTYVMLFTAKEDKQEGNYTYGTFDYWNGYTRKFVRDSDTDR